MVTHSGLPNFSSVENIDLSDVSAEPITKPQLNIKATSLAYVIYTSGSTGQPKGVMIEHRQLTDYVFGLDKAIEIHKSKSYALVSSMATDLGNTVIFSSLAFGGVLR